MGYEMTQGCLPRGDRRDLAELGITDLVLDRAELRAEYDFASGGMTVDFQAVSGDWPNCAAMPISTISR